MSIAYNRILQVDNKKIYTMNLPNEIIFINMKMYVQKKIINIKYIIIIQG